MMVNVPHLRYILGALLATILAPLHVIIQIYFTSSSSSFVYYYYYDFFPVLLPIFNLNDDVNRNDYPSHAMMVAGTCVSFVTTVSFTLRVLVVV